MSIISPILTIFFTGHLFNLQEPRRQNIKRYRTKSTMKDSKRQNWMSIQMTPLKDKLLTSIPHPYRRYDGRGIHMCSYAF